MLELVKPSGDYTLTIYYITGRVIDSREVNFESGEVNFEVKTRGMYIVALQNTAGTHKQKIIVD